MIYYVKNILLNDDGSGELWVGDSRAFLFERCYKDVAALLGRTLIVEGDSLFVRAIGDAPGQFIGRLGDNLNISWVNQRRFVEAVSR